MSMLQLAYNARRCGNQGSESGSRHFFINPWSLTRGFFINNLNIKYMVVSHWQRYKMFY
jgi:hypothetical protein